MWPALMTGPAPDDVSLTGLCARLIGGLIVCAALAALMIVSWGTIS